MRKRQPTITASPIDVSQLQCLSVPEVARILSIGRTSVYALINAGTLQIVRVGNSGRVRVLVVSLHEYIERQKLMS
jgi:excisionase family DNA binding protein